MKAFLRQHRLATFIVLTYAMSWALWLAIFPQLKPSLFEFDGKTLLIFLLGAYSPSLTALLLTAYLDGAAGVKKLLQRLWQWRVGGWWCFLALVIGLVIYALGIALYVGNGGFIGGVNYGLLPWIPAVFGVSLFLGPLAEELGWRGFVLPCLTSSCNFTLASIALGVIWGAWHFPLFWAVIGTSVSGFPVTFGSVGLFFLATIGSSFFYVWMFNKTAGSVFIAVLIHLSWNASGNIIGLLFPEMNADQKLALYHYPVALVWLIIFISAAFYGWQNWRAAKAIN